jgi:hypothetical protein
MHSISKALRDAGVPCEPSLFSVVQALEEGRFGGLSSVSASLVQVIPSSANDTETLFISFNVENLTQSQKVLDSILETSKSSKYFVILVQEFGSRASDRIAINRNFIDKLSTEGIEIACQVLQNGERCRNAMFYRLRPDDELISHQIVTMIQPELYSLEAFLFNKKERHAQICQFRIQNKTVAVLNIHLEAIPEKYFRIDVRAGFHQQQFFDVCRQVQNTLNSSKYYVVGGDTNIRSNPQNPNELFETLWPQNAPWVTEEFRSNYNDGQDVCSCLKNQCTPCTNIATQSLAKMNERDMKHKFPKQITKMASIIDKSIGSAKLDLLITNAQYSNSGIYDTTSSDHKQIRTSIDFSSVP